jgi:hypothetical protein
MRPALWLLCAAGTLSAESFSYWIQPCSSDISQKASCVSSDAQLAQWALDAWHRVASTKLAFSSAPQDHARIRVYWASGQMRLYGEARPIQVDGQRGAAIYVNPDVTQLGDEIAAAASDDRLLRDAIVYLTCLHESGHALGLTHTGKFEDIMYSFGFGGNIVEYFERYRHRLVVRSDIRIHSGISDYDRERLLELFRNHP